MVTTNQLTKNSMISFSCNIIDGFNRTKKRIVLSECYFINQTKMNLFARRNALMISALFLSSVLQAQTGAPAPYGALPTARQLKWQETEMY